MTEQPAIITARHLADALNGLKAELEETRKASEGRDEALADYGRRNRHRIWASWALVAVDIALSVIVALFAVQAHDASSRAATVAASNLALCQATNTSRAQQVSLWTYLISLSAPPATAQEREALAKFVQRLHVMFAPRDCTALGQKEG